MNEYPYPPIDYLARDYNSLRQMLLDRLALQLPSWTERHEADLGLALVELLAYAGDYLSYYQDAVGAEAYLATARQRVSLRRHARLLDSMLGDGLNARTFVALETVDDHLAIPAGTPLLTQTATFDTSVPRSMMKTYDGTVFETMHDVTLFRASNRMAIFTTSAEDYSLPAGTTTVTLCGALPQLQTGDVLILQASNSSVPAHPIRIAEKPTINKSPRGTTTTIAWLEADALPCDFPVIIRQMDGQILAGCTMLLGNVVLADEGRTVTQHLAPVPREDASTPYRPKLIQHAVIHAVPYVHADAVRESAREALTQDPQAALALIALEEMPPPSGHINGPVSGPTGAKPLRIHAPIHQARLSARDLRANRVAPIHIAAPPTHPQEDRLIGKLMPPRTWTVRQDLLSSFGNSMDFVAEIDNDGAACLRFGDGVNGRKPAAGTAFRASYRIGHGAAGNVATDAIAHIAGFEKRILSVRNPLPATGARNPDDPAQVRLNAPQAYAAQRRCITMDDYTAMTCAFPGIGSATATRTWNAAPAPAPGIEESPFSYGATVKIVPLQADGREITKDTAIRLKTYLQAFAYMGDQLLITSPLRVSRQLHLQVSVAPGYQIAMVQSLVEAAVQAKLQLAPFSLGEVVRTSPYVALVSAVPGVADVNAVFHVAPGEAASTDGRGMEVLGLQPSGYIDPGPQGVAHIASFAVSSAPSSRRELP